MAILFTPYTLCIQGHGKNKTVKIQVYIYITSSTINREHASFYMNTIWQTFTLSESKACNNVQKIKHG